MMTASDACTQTFTVAVPFDRVARLFHDPDVLTAALVEADAGARLARMTGESSDVTVMFGDVEGFTPLTERVGDRAAAGVVCTLDGLVHAALRAEGGLRAASSGDGFMAVFADPAPALRSACRIQWSLAGRSERETRVRMRLGVHTGPVVRIRTVNGAPDIVGRTVILASRITDAARGGEVLVSSTARQRTERLDEFNFRRARRVRLKGMAGVHRVTPLGWRASCQEGVHGR
jgi:class 3 adenylate cyclase